MSRHVPGEVLQTTKRGVEIRFSPSMGSSTKYRVTCPHGNGVNDRTFADAREDARIPEEWCAECAEQSHGG